VREMRDRAGTERDVHERIQLEEALALRLGVAAADRDDPFGVLLLQRLRLGEVGSEALIRLLPDRAGVEDENVRVALASRLAEPARPTSRTSASDSPSSRSRSTSARVIELASPATFSAKSITATSTSSRPAARWSLAIATTSAGLWKRCASTWPCASAQ